MGDGVAAVAAVERRDYALVLMDMEMPVLGGLDAARRIRALGGPAGSVPIVALTANVFPEQLALCRAAGMDDHLTKPFGADDLAARVSDARRALSDRTWVEEQNRRLIEEMLLEPEAHHWVHVSSEDIGEAGCRHWHVRPRWGILGMFLNWWRVVISSGCPLPAA